MATPKKAREKADFAAKRAQRALAALREAYGTLTEIQTRNLSDTGWVPEPEDELDKIADAISAVQELGLRKAREAGWSAEDLVEAGFESR